MTKARLVRERHGLERQNRWAEFAGRNRMGAPPPGANLSVRIVPELTLLLVMVKFLGAVTASGASA